MQTKMKIDTQTRLTQIEAGKIVTHFRGKGKRIKYRELIGFSPEEASKTSSAKKFELSAVDIAKAAGREEV